MASQLNQLTARRINELYGMKLEAHRVVVEPEDLGDEIALDEDILEPYKCWTVENIQRNAQGRIRIQVGEGGSELKCFSYHLAYKWANPDVEVPSTLGNGPSIDHLCGRAFCHRPSHLQLVQEHKHNTARIGCFGNMFVVTEQGEIAHCTQCKHSPSCMKVYTSLLGPFN